MKLRGRVCSKEGRYWLCKEHCLRHDKQCVGRSQGFGLKGMLMGAVLELLTRNLQRFGYKLL